MTITKHAKWMLIGIVLFGIAAYLYYKVERKEEKKLFQTQKLEHRTITRIIDSTGKLEAQGTLHIGSLINGIVEALYVKENQQVKKGDLLARIDDGKKDTAVRYSSGLLKKAKVDLVYQEKFYKRQKQMCKFNQISQDEFDQAQQAYDAAKETVDAQQAFYEQSLLEFNNKKITSPIDGVIIKKNVSLQEGVANFSPPTILFTIAEDIRKMDVELEVDEIDVGLIKIGQEAKLYFDTYPHKSFRGNIIDISNAPIDEGVGISYKATIKIDNRHLFLKPGMTVRARITVGSKKNVLSIPGYVFSLNKKFLELIAKEKGFIYKPLSAKQKAAFSEKIKDKNNAIKTVWIFKDNYLEQKPIEIGITDNAFFEIVSGINETDNVVIDIEEPDVMAKLYQQLFGTKLS